MANKTLTTEATFTPGKYNQDDILNIARLAWQLSGNAESQKKQYGSDSIDMFSGNRASMMKVAQDYLNGVTTRVPQLDIALDKAVQQHFGSKTVASLSDRQDVKLRPSEFERLRTKYKVGKINFDMFFRRENGDIFLKSEAPIEPLDVPAQAFQEPLVIDRGPSIVDLDPKTGLPIKDRTERVPVATPTPTTPPKDLTDTSVLPDFIKNSDVFKALSSKNQELIAIQWNGIQATSAMDKIRINEALKEATKLADPLFKQSILLARDTLERNLKDTLATNKEAKDKLEMELSIMKEDFVTKSSRMNEAQRESALKDLETISIVKDQAIREGESREAGVAADIRRINRRVEAINKDLEFGRGDIAIEEQAQLARYLKDYQRTLQATQEQAVDAGLGFSSIRTEAEKRLAEDLQDVSVSTQRQKARELRSLENQAGRETSELVATQADIDRKNKEMRVDLAKQMEQKLGYSAVPDDIRKYLPAPTIINKEGTVLRGEAERVQQERARELQQKEEDIKTSTKRAEADAQRQRQILEREREKSVATQKRKAEEVLGSEEAQKAIPIGPAPIGGITGTLEQQQAESIQRIGKSLFDTGFYPEEDKK